MKNTAIAAVAFAAATLISGAASAQSATAGGQVFNARCASCHTDGEGGPNKTGPNLFGVFGSEIGSRDIGFRFSNALRNSDKTWGDAELDAWLKSPRSFISGNRMSFGGLTSPGDRADVTAFLKTLK